MTSTSFSLLLHKGPASHLASYSSTTKEPAIVRSQSTIYHESSLRARKHTTGCKNKDATAVTITSSYPLLSNPPAQNFSSLQPQIAKTPPHPPSSPSQALNLNPCTNRLPIRNKTRNPLYPPPQTPQHNDSKNKFPSGKTPTCL